MRVLDHQSFSGLECGCKQAARIPSMSVLFRSGFSMILTCACLARLITATLGWLVMRIAGAWIRRSRSLRSGRGRLFPANSDRRRSSRSQVGRAAIRKHRKSLDLKRELERVAYGRIVIHDNHYREWIREGGFRVHCSRSRRCGIRYGEQEARNRDALL